MNLVEISEMLKGAPDTYLTQHIQSPDGTVPQYLALAELQRRQDMRARFTQQSPQTTVADDATQGIAAAAPEMAPPMAPPQAPPQGYAKGGEVKDTTLDQILYRLGIRNLPSEKSKYESTMRRAEERLRSTEGKMSNQYREHMQNVMRAQDAALASAREAMIPSSTPALDQEFARQAAELSPEDVDAGYREFLERQRQRKLREDAIPGYPVGTDLDKVFAPIPAGYKEGGLVEEYIGKAGKFESGNNRNAKNPFSSASGRFQFIDSTRRRLDKKYGFDPKDRSDETEMARMRAYTNETIQALESANIPVTGGTLYGGHFLGQGGIKKFFEAYRKDPSTNVSEHFSAEIIRKNPAIFNPRGGKARTTLAEVMEKFDKVGGGRQRTPMTDEDMNMGAAIQVANRADRGDIGPYEDMNLAQASALAQLLEGSKLGQGPMVGYPRTQREPDPSFFYNPVDAQIKAKLLERYTNPGIAGGVPGFNQGGMVKGYSGADGVSSVSSRRPEGTYRYNPVTGQLEVDPNAPPYMPNMMAVDRGEVVPEFEYTDAELARQFGGGGKSITKDAKDSISPQSKNYDPMWGTAFLMGQGDMPPDAVTGSAEKHREFLRSKKENKKESPATKEKTTPTLLEARLNRVNAARGAAGLSLLKSASEITFADIARANKADVDSLRSRLDELQAMPYKSMSQAGRAVEDVGGFLGRVLPNVGIVAGDIGVGIGNKFSDWFDPIYDPNFQSSQRPGARPPSKFFYTPASAASTGGSGILGGAEIKLPPTAPSAQPTAEEVAAAGRKMREEAGAAPAGPAAPAAPAAAPPASQADSFADQFLKELRDAKMSKEEMRQTALLQAGLGMMTGTSPNFLANVGQGAMAGLQAYQQAKAQNQALASEAYKNMMAARALGLEEEKVGISRTEADALKKYREDMVRLQKDELAAKNAIEALKNDKGVITQKDVFEAINRRFADMSKERDSNVLAYRDPNDPSKPMPDTMLRNIARQQIQNVLYDSGIVIGGGAGITTVEVPSG